MKDVMKIVHVMTSEKSDLLLWKKYESVKAKAKYVQGPHKHVFLTKSRTASAIYSAKFSINRGEKNLNTVF